MPRELSASEVAVFQLAHPNLGVIPANGLAVQDGSRYVLVWLDAMQRWHHIDLTGATQFDELVKNKPPFVSPDGSLIDALWEQLGTVGSQAQNSLNLLLLAVGVVVVLFVFVELRSVSSS